MFKIPLIFFSQDSRVNQKIRIPYPIFIVFAIIMSAISACGVDLVKTSDIGACQSAIDSSEWDTAISKCTGKDLGDAYMGKGGYNVGNLMSNSGGETTPYHITNKNAKITTVDSNSAKVLYIIGTAYSQVKDNATRKKNIEAAKDAFDNAISSYASVIPNDQEAAILYMFANTFALQLSSVILNDSIDHGCKSTTECDPDADPVTKYVDSSYPSLENYDGYIFPEDKNAKRRSLSTVKAYCEKMAPQGDYINQLVDGISKSGMDVSGSNTAIVSNTKTATCEIFDTLKLACEAGDTACESACSPTGC